MKNRIISLLLALALLFSLTSCKKETDETPVLDGGLTVETVKVEYSEEAVAGATEDIIALFEKTVDILGYAEHITDDDISEVEGKFKNEIIPALIDLKIYPEELSALIKATDECLALWEENNVENDPKNFSDMYTKLVSIIDTDRLGGLIFELEMTLIGARLEKAEKKYNDHTSSLNLRKLEYYRTLVASAEALGREKFADAMEVILFGVSSLNSKTEFEGGISVSVADTLEIMKKQGERFLSLTLTDEDWQTVARMCEEYIPGKANESLQSKILITLNNDDFFIEAADVMPDVIKLYAALTSDISAEDKALIESEAEYAYETVLARQAVKHESEFEEFMLALEEKFPEATSSSISSVKSYDKAGYNAFVAQYSADFDGLMEALRAFAISPDDTTYNSLTNAYYGYMAQLNSVVAYVYLYK